LAGTDYSQLNGLVSGNYAIWNKVWAAATVTAGTALYQDSIVAKATGSNGYYIFAFSPTITTTSATLIKTYGQDWTTSANLVTGGALSGLVQAAPYGNVFTQDSLTGTTITIAGATGGLAASSAVGTYSGTLNVSGVTVKGYSTTSPNGYTIGSVNAATATIKVIPAQLTVTGATVTNKVFDNTFTATLTGGTLSGSILAGDVVTLAGAGVGAFTSRDVGTGIRVTASGFSLGGGSAANYVLTQPTGLSGNITPLALTLTTATNFDKVYDTTTAAANPLITSTTTLPTGQTITFSGSAGFASANVVCSATCNGTNASSQAVSITGIKAVAGAGTLLSNYSFSTSGLSAAGTISPATITVS
jgi:hypothetical protein